MKTRSTPSEGEASFFSSGFSGRRNVCLRVGACLFSSVFFIAACGGGDTGTSTDSSAPTGVLSGVCPETIVIQTDWFPESEHGALYQLVGSDYEVDSAKKIVKGSLVDSTGSDTGVDIEIRTGGPAIGDNPVSTTMTTDSSITMGYINTDDAAFSYNNGNKFLAVVAPLEINPQIIMWDPETYPDVKTIADLGDAGVTLNVFGGGSFLQVFVAEGVLDEAQLDTSYDGSPGRFIAEGGKIAQQGFASSEPYLYKNEFDWGKDVAFQLIHDAGFEIYAAPLAIRAEDKEALSPCLKLFVPMVQQAAIDFITDASRANAIIIDAVQKFADFWVYSEGVAKYSTAKQKELGLVGNGSDSVLGNFDLERANRALDQMRDSGLEVPADLTAEDIYTNEFIDPTIGLE